MTGFKIKTILTTIVVFCISTMAMSQISAGGRIGVNLANLHGSSVNNNSMLIGYNIGGFANYKLTDILSGDLADIMSVQAEFSVQTKGASEIDFTASIAGIDDLTTSVKQVFTYVQIPVLAKFTFPTNGDLKYFGEGGFYMGALFGVTFDDEISYDHDDADNTDRRKYREEYSGFDFGATLGGGAIMPFGGRNSPWEAFINVRYSLGLMNIGDVKDNTPEELKGNFEDVKTNTLSILLGVIYSF